MPDNEEALLKEIRERFDYCVREWADIREEGRTDMKFVAGDVWDPKDRAARKDADRPCLNLDELNQYTNQCINGVRQSRRAIQVNAKGYGATEELAELRANLIRAIEYKSNAQQAYITGFENVVNRSYGAWRVSAQYRDDDSDLQELVIKRIANPDTVYVDPDCKEADASDMQYAFVIESYNVRDFRNKWPDADIQSFSSDLAAIAPSWIKLDGGNGDNDRVQVAEYWKVKTTKRTRVKIQGTKMFLDEMPGAKIQDGALVLPDGTQIMADSIRKVDDRTVCQYITNGVEILEENEWPGKYIPIIWAQGKELYVDDGGGSKRQLFSLVRLARDAAKLYAYYRTTEAELVGMTPKTPFVGYEGQFEQHEEEWQNANKRPTPYLQAKALTEATGGQILPLPQRQPYDPPIQAMEVGAESARRAIQAAMAISNLPTQAQRQNEKSGIALQRIAEQQTTGSYHFVDNFLRSIEHTGRVINDLLEYYYRDERDEMVRMPDDQMDLVTLNAVTKDKQGRIVDTSLAKGKYDVTISTGDSFQSERERTSDFIEKLSQNQEIFPRIADLAVKNEIPGPMGEKIAERLVPPDVAAKEQNQQPIPPQVQAAMQQMNQHLQALNAYAQKIEEENKLLKSGAITKQAEIESRERIEAMKAQVDLIKTQAQIDANRAEVMLKSELQAIQMKVDALDAAAAHERAAEDSQIAQDQFAAQQAQAQQQPEQPAQ